MTLAQSLNSEPQNDNNHDGDIQNTWTNAYDSYDEGNSYDDDKILKRKRRT